MGFSTSIAVKDLICCYGWFDPKQAHPIKKGETIYWRKERKRPMGYCQRCIRVIIQRYEEQLQLFKSSSKANEKDTLLKQKSLF